MSKKKKKPVPVAPKKRSKTVTVFNQDSVTATLANKPYIVVRGKTGAHITEKDRPRKKIKVRDIDRYL